VSYLLNIETATKNCSVSLSKSGQLLALKEVNTGGFSHAEQLHVFLAEILQESQLTFKDLSAVAVGKGPGSYTGLRIGVSAAKGLCYALEIPMIALETLTILAHAISISEGVLVPMLDARRSEVYSAVFDPSYQQIRATEAQIIEPHSFGEALDKGPVYFLGDGAEKCKEIIRHPNAIFRDDFFPSAREMSALAYEKYMRQEFEDVAYFEPFYLKDFVGTKSKKRS